MDKYTVYILVCSSNIPYYVGMTKNFKIRIYEHGLLQGKNKAKDNKIRKYGIKTVSRHNLSLEDAQALEKKLIKKYRKYLTNKHAGGNFVPHQPENKRKRTKTKRRSKCKTCGRLFLQIKRHKCNETR